MKKFYYSEDKRLAEIGQRLFEGEDLNQVTEVPVMTSLHLLERLRIGRGQYTNMRLVLLRYLFEYQCCNFKLQVY